MVQRLLSNSCVYHYCNIYIAWENTVLQHGAQWSLWEYRLILLPSGASRNQRPTIAREEMLDLSIEPIIFDIVVVLVVLVSVTIRRIRDNRRLPLPPGPKPLPFIGNALDFPDSHLGRFWAKHKDLYGKYGTLSGLQKCH